MEILIMYTCLLFYDLHFYCFVSDKLQIDQQIFRAWQPKCLPRSWGVLWWCKYLVIGTQVFVYVVSWNTKNNKYPGSDGFTIEFYNDFCFILKRKSVVFPVCHWVCFGDLVSCRSDSEYLFSSKLTNTCIISKYCCTNCNIHGIL